MRYFVVKTASADGLHSALQRGVWGVPQRLSTPQPRELLNDAFVDGGVILIASANSSKRWQGLRFRCVALNTVALQRTV
jgi:hypothetical protein